MPTLIEAPALSASGAPCSAAGALDGGMAGTYVRRIAAAGVGSMIANVGTRLMAVKSGPHLLPVTVDDGGTGASYVCQPHSAYALYARRELDIEPVGALRWPAIAAIAGLGWVLAAARINRVVHIDNWMLSTNLHGDWNGADLPALRRLLATRFPDHMLAIRTLDEWSSPELLQAARDDGWTLVPSRQVWVVEDLARSWLPRNNYGNDKRALARSGLAVELIAEMDEASARRIAELYRLLYVDRYSALNPIFTARFVQMTHDIGMVRYLVARRGDGIIMAVGGMLERAGIMTPSIVGYDTHRPQSEALYRVASFMFMDWALQRGWRLHGSAGAATFKRGRGAEGVIEYAAYHTAHLGRSRRLVVAALAAGLERFVVPMMRRRGL